MDAQQEGERIVSEARHAVEGWLLDGHQLFERWTLSAQEEHERLRLRAEMAETECEKLRQEIQALQQDNELLRREGDRFQRTQTEMTHVFAATLSGMTKVLEPLNELASRLGRAADERGAAHHV